jgi:hypothetical protein
MHLYTKKNIDTVALKAVMKRPIVILPNLTQEDIDQYKL